MKESSLENILISLSKAISIAENTGEFKWTVALQCQGRPLQGKEKKKNSTKDRFTKKEEKKNKLLVWCSVKGINHSRNGKLALIFKEAENKRNNTFERRGFGLRIGWEERTVYPTRTKEL